MTFERELQAVIAEAEQSHEDYMEAMDRALGNRSLFHRMHEIDHRGEQVLDPEESHHALTDLTDREAQERRMLELAQLDMSNMTQPDEWF